MKKLLRLLMIVVVIGSGCNKDDVPKLKNIEFSITRGMWELIGEPDEIGSYYYCIIDVPELTSNVCNKGLIQCYYCYVDDFGDEVQTPMPFTFYGMDVYEESGYQWENPWSVHYSYDVTPGSIAFKIVFSDFLTANWTPPARCTFRLLLVY